MILNYKMFDPKLSLETRDWSDEDVERIRLHFETLNFDVIPRNDLTYDATIKFLQEGMCKR